MLLFPPRDVYKRQDCRDASALLCDFGPPAFGRTGHHVADGGCKQYRAFEHGDRAAEKNPQRYKYHPCVIAEGESMKAVLQRVRSASVVINGAETRSIGPGLVILLGVSDTDSTAMCEKLAHKFAGLRIFDDENGNLNVSAEEKGYEAMRCV